jgi:ketosteroid isomerase-like protein
VRRTISELLPYDREPQLINPSAEVVEAFLAAWVAGDVEAAAARFAVDGIYALHLSADLLQHGGEAVGRNRIAEALRYFGSRFDLLASRPANLRFNEDIVRTQVEFRYRHRLSREVLSGRFRLVFRVRDRQIVRADEYHDRLKVEAFIRLFAHPSNA